MTRKKRELVLIVLSGARDRGRGRGRAQRSGARARYRNRCGRRGMGWVGMAHRVEHETTSRKNIPVNVEVRCS